MTTSFPATIAPHFPELSARWDAIPDQYRGNAMAMLQLAESAREVGGDVPLRVTSWYRSPVGNLLAGGASTSQHLTASAMDLVPDRGGLMLYFRQLARSLYPESYGQLIFERDHIHLSLPNRTNGQTGQVLIETSEGHYVDTAGYVTPPPTDAERGNGSVSYYILAAIAVIAVIAGLFVLWSN